MSTITLATISNGTSLDANPVNTNFTTIAGVINGNIDTVNLKDGSVSTAKVSDDAITAAKMIKGFVFDRQGGDTAAWATPGTTTYDTSASTVILQTGSGTSSAGGDTAVTFPTAYTNTPFVIGGFSTTGGSSFIGNEVFAVTNTGFSYNNFSLGGSRVLANFAWIAIGI